MRFLSPTII